MSLKINVSNTWNAVKYTHVKANNTWNPIINAFVNVNNVWKPLYSYWWYMGNWSGCSATCGGGVQTRQVTCVREHAGESNHGSDWMDVADTFCTRSGLAKPATSQGCNTQPCTECRYTVTTGADNYGTCYDTSIKITNAWTTVRGEGFFAHSSASITWDGASVGSTLDFNATTAVVNGYLYTRSTSKENCGNINTSIPGSTQYTYYNFYDVCRTPV